jgi:Chalcone isomerase-like
MVRLILPLLLCTQLALGAEVAGVKVDERVKLGSSELQLNGAGVRTRIIFKVYVGALYLPERKSGAAEVLALKGAKRISMTLLRNLGAKQLTDALD